MIDTSGKIVKIFIQEADEEYFDETVNVILDDEIESLSGKFTTEKSEAQSFDDMIE